MPVASNTRPAEPVGPPSAEVVADEVVVLGERGAHGFGDAALAADQQRPGQRRVARAVAAQGLGLRNAELFGQKRAGAGVDHLRVQVGWELGSHRAASRVTVEMSTTNLLQSKNSE